MPYKLRASDGTLVWDIKDYKITDNDIELITTLEGKNLSLSETEYLIILNNEKQYLLKSFEDNGEYIRIDKKDYYSKIQLNGSVPYKFNSDDFILEDNSSENKKPTKKNRYS